MTNHFLIETRQLEFAFTAKDKILHPLDLKVPQGSIYGFLGPNGAGKTTTLRLLLGLLKANNDSIRLFGMDFQSNRLSILKRIGCLIEQPSLYLHLTGRENLEVFRLAYRCDRKRIDEVLEITGLREAAGKKAKAYSLGMKQRLAIGIALLHDPELLILDEPTNGLDPYGIIETRALLKKLNQEFGKTILVSSHLLAEVEKLATHVGIINKGKLLFQGTLPELQQMRSTHSVIEVEVDDPDKAKLLLNSQLSIRKSRERTLHVDFVSNEQIATLNELLVRNDIKVYRIGLVRTDLEDLFIQIIAA